MGFVASHASTSYFYDDREFHILASTVIVSVEATEGDEVLVPALVESAEGAVPRAL